MQPILRCAHRRGRTHRQKRTCRSGRRSQGSGLCQLQCMPLAGDGAVRGGKRDWVPLVRSSRALRVQRPARVMVQARPDHRAGCISCLRPNKPTPSRRCKRVLPSNSRLLLRVCATATAIQQVARVDGLRRCRVSYVWDRIETAQQTPATAAVAAGTEQSDEQHCA